MAEEAPKDTAPESQDDEISAVPTPTAEAPAPTPVATTTPPETTLPVRVNPLCRTYNATLLNDAARYIGERRDTRLDFEARLANFMERQRQTARAPRTCGHNLTNPHDSLFSLAKPCALAPSHVPAMCPATGAAFAVCCNSCEMTIPDVHYHCSTCDDGDFDLCQSCIDQGITCHGKDHWLIKRMTVNGQLVQSTTETIAPKPKPEVKVETTIETKVEPKIESKIEPKDEVPSLPHPMFEPLAARWASLGVMRTCNCCVRGMYKFSAPMPVSANPSRIQRG